MHHFNVFYDMLCHRYLSLNQLHPDAHTYEQLLTKAKEETICKWLKYMGMTGCPVSKESLHVKVGSISTVLQKKLQQTGKQHILSRTWIYKFLAWNPDLQLRRPTGLDPKHTQNFNCSVVMCHFQILNAFLKQPEIPWENIYNMDKKGIQLGSGRKLDNTKFLYSWDQHNWVKLQSADLELVTKIECVSANRLVLNLGIIFCGKNVLHDEYFEQDRIL